MTGESSYLTSMSYSEFSYVCVHVYVCVDSYTQVCSRQRLIADIFLSYFPFIFFLLKQDHKLNKEFTYLGNTSGEENSQDPFVPISILGLQMYVPRLGFCSGCWESEFRALGWCGKHFTE